MWLPQWFESRRSLANGIAFSGAGTGGLIFPFIFQPSLERLGFAWTLRIWALILLVGAGTGLCFVKPRLPARRATETERQHTRATALKDEFSYMLTPLWGLNVSAPCAPSYSQIAQSR